MAIFRSIPVLGLSMVIFSLFGSYTFLLAGDLDSPSAPGETSSYTLEDVYNRLNDGTAGTQSIFTEPESGPTIGTMHTINEIVGKSPSVDGDGAGTEHVMSGKTFWGLQSQGGWGTKTGSLATRTPSNATVSQPAGFYEEFNLSTVDSDLATANIKAGTSIFGVTGTYEGSASSAAVARTGQNLCYSSSGVVISCDNSGQDGEYQKGVAWPNPRFTDSGRGTVTDNLTGLIWLKNANAPNGTRTFQQALDDVVELNTSGTMNGNDCGDTSNLESHQTDWRLPNRKELESLIDLGYFQPALSNTAGTGQWVQGDPFIGVQSNYYWSNTPRAHDTSYIWVIELNLSILGYSGWGEYYCVWPVRAGQ